MMESNQPPLINYDRQRFGKAVRIFRGDENHNDFAERIGFSAAVLSRIERGKVVEAESILRICEAMQVTLEQFPPGAVGRKLIEKSPQSDKNEENS
ncbi:MAG: helix-turn-helix transcriptional regulator [Chitinophagaceae bacterium]|nr:helix-turn-helix transcriptional regulator [Anaerolineae bacterium]